MKLSEEAAALEELICKVFSGQTLGEGIGMREADAYDDRENADTVIVARSQDERNSWKSLVLEDVRRYCTDGWWYLDEAGLAFHLPAMLRVELHKKGEVFLLLKLAEPSHQRDVLWKALARDQKLVVHDFLAWAGANAVSDWGRDLCLKGIVDFWSLERIDQGEQAAASDGDNAPV